MVKRGSKRVSSNRVKLGNSHLKLLFAILCIGILFSLLYLKQKTSYQKDNTKSITNSPRVVPREQLLYIPPAGWKVTSGDNHAVFFSPDFEAGKVIDGQLVSAKGATIGISKRTVKSVQEGTIENIQSLEDYVKKGFAAPRQIQTTEIVGELAYSFRDDVEGFGMNYATKRDDSLFTFSLSSSDETTLNAYLPEFEKFISSLDFRKAR